MKIRFKMSWRNFIPDQVVESIPDGTANLLIDRGIAEQVKDEPQKTLKGKK